MTTEATVKGSGLFNGLRRTVPLVLVIAGVVPMASCASDTVSQGQGGSYVILDLLEGARGGTDSLEFSTVMQSDVLTNGGVYEDPGRVQMRLALKDVGTAASPTTPTTNNFITVTRYRVVFRRSDGRNNPGVDVPYSFDGAATFTVGAQAVTGAFTLVRAQAKLEPPLIALAGGGGALLISTLADVTFYGRDQAGNDVSVTGSISVNFADWADPKKETASN
jgi:hypothetical protein